VLIRVMSVLRVVLIARGRLRQGGEAGFRAEGVALIYVVKEPRFAAGVDGCAGGMR